MSCILWYSRQGTVAIFGPKKGTVVKTVWETLHYTQQYKQYYLLNYIIVIRQCDLRRIGIRLFHLRQISVGTYTILLIIIVLFRLLDECLVFGLTSVNRSDAAVGKSIYNNNIIRIHTCCIYCDHDNIV